jgi:hypothetical protein
MNRRKLGAELLECIDHAPSRQHHVEYEVDLRLQALQQPSDLGAQPIDPVGDCSSFGQDHPAGFCQLRLASGFPVEERHPELRLQVGD